jgi:hypothetical protein
MTNDISYPFALCLLAEILPDRDNTGTQNKEDRTQDK